MKPISILGLLAASTLAAGANAQTVFVTTSADVSDVTGSAGIADLPGPDGVVSFREALLVTDNTPGHQTVGFQIPTEDWYLSEIYPGLVLVQGSFNWSAWDTVTIDGTTQTAFTGDTNPDGNEVVLYGLTFNLNGDGSELVGLYGSNINVWGSNCTIHDNDGYIDIDVVLGSGNQVTDNFAGTIKIQQANDNVVVRNTTERVRIFGGGTGNPALNNRIGGTDVADRNFITGWGNYGEHGTPAGTTVELLNTRGTLIQNNYIGTTPDGMSIGNQASTAGVAILNENFDLVVRDNLIATHATNAWGAGDYGAPIFINLYEGGNNIEIAGNTLGLNAAGEAVLGGLHGIWIDPLTMEYATDVRIGGTASGQANVIAGHVSNGVHVLCGPGISPVGGIRLSGNSIYGNGDLGIELTPNTWTFGPTPNDPLDADDGANGLQNHPEILAADLVGLALRVAGTLHSTPLREYTVELFASPTCDASGFGQGEVFLGSTTVFTDAAGNASFMEMLPATVPERWFVTATATREPIGATSELSACKIISAVRTNGRPGASSPPKAGGVRGL